MSPYIPSIFNNWHIQNIQSVNNLNVQIHTDYSQKFTCTVYASTTEEKMLQSAWQTDILHIPWNSNKGNYAYLSKYYIHKAHSPDHN
jgi:hypothetical protein